MASQSVFDDVFGDSSELPPPPQSNGASALVNSGFQNAQNYASNAFNTAVAFLSQIQGAAAQLQTIPAVDGTLGAIGDVVHGFVTPTLPQPPAGLAMNLPQPPTLGALTPVSSIAVGAAPAFSAPLPSIDLPDAPLPLQAVVPLAPGLNEVDIPAAPNIVLPDTPSLVGINVPAEPLLNLPTFTAVTPDSPLAPAYIFSFAEPVYTSDLLTGLRAQLESWVLGASTGLAPAVEQAIWERARAREIVSSQRKINESIRMFAQRGFAKPPGALNLDIQQALQDSQDNVSSQSRDVMVKQADLEQTNRRFAFETAWKVEEGLITYQSAIAQRSFETAKFAQQVGIDIYHETVARYTADIQSYAARVDAYKALLQGELSKLDVYRAEIEAQKLIGEINQQAIAVYTARLDGAKTIVEIFRTTVEAANLEATVNKTLIEAYASQVGAYAEQVRAKAQEYDGFATLVKAQSTKVDMYSAEASAYNSEVQGFKSTVDALVAAKNIDIRVGQELPIEVFKSLTDTYRTQVQAESDRVNSLTEVYKTNAQVFSAEVQGESSRVGSEVDVYKADAQVLEAAGNLRVEAAKANVQTMLGQINALIEAMKSGAQVAAQLAAASLSSVNLSGQIGDHTSYGVGYNVSNSSASSVSDNRSDVTSSATNTSQSTSTATVQSTSSSDVTSTANNTNYNYSN